MCSFCNSRLSRRGLLAGLTAVSLAGCSENAATGRRQLVVVSDSQLAEMADASWAQIVAQTPPLRDSDVQARLARIGRPLALALTIGMMALSPATQHEFISGGDMLSNGLYVPVGMAHGFCTLTDRAEVLYKTSSEYAPETEGGLLWSDPALQIAWPVSPSEATVNARDQGWPGIAELHSPFSWEADR